MVKNILLTLLVLLLLPFTLFAQGSDKRFIISGGYVLNHSTDYNPSHLQGLNLSLSREHDVSDFITLGGKIQLANFYFDSAHYLDNNDPHSSDAINASSDPALLVGFGSYIKPVIYQKNGLIFDINIGLQFIYMERSDLRLIYLNSNQERALSAENDFFGVIEMGPDISFMNVFEALSLHLKMQYNIGPRISRARAQTTLRYTSVTLGVGF